MKIHQDKRASKTFALLALTNYTMKFTFTPTLHSVDKESIHDKNDFVKLKIDFSLIFFCYFFHL